MTLTCYLNGDKRFICPDAGIDQLLKLPIYGGARRLIREGYPLETAVSFWRGETPVIHQATIGHLGQYTVQETDKHGLKKRKAYDPRAFQPGNSGTEGLHSSDHRNGSVRVAEWCALGSCVGFAGCQGAIPRQPSEPGHTVGTCVPVGDPRPMQGCLPRNGLTTR